MSHALADAIFWIAVASCTIAQVAILRSILTVAPPGAPVPAASATRAHRAMEIVWAILPAIALAAVLLFTWRAMQRWQAADSAPSTHSTHSTHSLDAAAPDTATRARLLVP